MMIENTEENSVYGRRRPRYRSIQTQLQEQAQGIGPSAAQELLRSGMDRGLAQSLSMSRGAQGMSPALALRQGQQAQTGLASAMSGQAATLRAQEMAEARGALANWEQERARMRFARQQAQLQFWGGLIGTGLQAGGKVGAAGMAA